MKYGKDIYVNAVNWTKQKVLFGVVTFICLFAGCSAKKEYQTENMRRWLQEAKLEEKESAEELYQAALTEDTLVIYSVSSRAFEVKEQFEKEYPGLTVEIKDVRGEDIVNMLIKNYENEDYACDVVICSDCDGSLYKKLLEPGVVYSYLPWDIAPKMNERHASRELVFSGEALMMFYNTNVFSNQPIHNIWELTEEKYRGRIMLASPLSSFSSYGFCSSILSESDNIAKAYESYKGKTLTIPKGQCAGEVFLEKVKQNIVFTNSSDEVLEGVGGKGNEDMWIGIMVSSKMRYQELGYHFSPIYQLDPFAAVYTPNSVTIAGGARNVNTAKLFIRYLVGEASGDGEGLKPFNTVGAWSTRIDVEDGNEVPISDIDMIDLDKNYLYENEDMLREFWKKVLKESALQE